MFQIFSLFFNKFLLPEELDSSMTFVRTFLPDFVEAEAVAAFLPLEAGG